jgi:hypothetical protein
MGQLSQFDKEATLGKDGRVTVSGSVAAEMDERGVVVPRSDAVRFHFLIVQGEHVLEGESVSSADLWKGTTSDAGQGLSMGPAVALGLAVEVKKQPTASFQTFTWVEEITLKPSG